MALNIDLVTTYFPKLDELTQEQLVSARTRIETALREVYPDIDVRPGSPLGDVVLSPFGMLVAMMEVAVNRFASDLDLENVASGVIYNCDFVERFLKNFAVFPQLSLKSTGVIRLVFNTNKMYELDRRMQFLNGTNVFTIRLPYIDHGAIHPGILQVLPVGSTVSPQENELVLSDLGNGTYAVEIPVEGQMDSTVEAAAIFEINMPIAELVTAYAVVNFDSGNPGTSLKSLAEKTRQTFPAAALTSKTCARSFMQKEFPDLLSASAMVTGDTLMLRSTANALGIVPGRVDLYVRSKQYDTVYEQVIRVKYDESLGKYLSKLALIAPTYYIENLSTQDVDGNTITLSVGSGLDIYSKSNNPNKAPLLTCAGTSYEDLWVAFDMPKYTSGVNIGDDRLATYTLNGVRYTNFTIRYYTDPLFKFIEQRVDASDVKPAGVDILVRPFIPIKISQFNVQYSKQTGVSVSIDNSRSEIYNYIRQLSYPKTYSNARISDSLFYAGADDVTNIVVTASPVWSAANKVLPASSPDIETDFEDADYESIDVPVYSITNTSGLVPVDSIYTGIKGAIGIANSCYLLPSSQTITFSEVLR
jgi:hypothetical protein